MKSKSFKNRTTKPVGLMYDHMIFHCKYNRKVLINKIRRRCEEIIRTVLDDIDCECVAMNVQPNHVHLLVGIPLTKTPSNVAMKIKGVSSYLLRKEFPILVEQIPKHLWAHSCVHQSVGNDAGKVITYIKNQYKKHGGRK